MTGGQYHLAAAGGHVESVQGTERPGMSGRKLDGEGRPGRCTELQVDLGQSPFGKLRKRHLGRRAQGDACGLREGFADEDPRYDRVLWKVV